MGFLGDEKKYAINHLESNTVKDYLKCRFSKSGTIPFLAKPPLYGLSLGIVYRIFHPELKYAYCLNFLFFTGTLFLLVFVGNTLHNKYGVLLGIASATVYALLLKHRLSDVLPSAMLTFILCSVSLFCIYAVKTYSTKYFSLLGISIGLGLLTKGDINFLAFLIPVFLLYFFFTKRKIIIKLFVLFISVAAVLIPWIIFVNITRIENKKAMTAWKTKLAETENLCMLDTTKNEDWENRGAVIRNNEYGKLASHHFGRYANSDKAIFISNQVTTDEFLSVHNEFNVDGHWHPEWRFRTTSIYNNNYKDASVPFKIARFYIDYPSFIFKIPMAKLMRTTSSEFSFFLLSAFLFGCFLWLMKINSEKRSLKFLFLIFSFILLFVFSWFNYPAYIVYSSSFFFSSLFLFKREMMKAIPFIFPLFVFSSYLIILIFYGDQRFTDVVEPLTIFSTLYFLYLMFSNIFQKQDGGV
ncbi:MAG: hypothetical protein POELPBGB_03284 [Bacteroidia bacterium]|nr:hypothetical protein [Bacteroidia bacterium]